MINRGASLSNPRETGINIAALSRGTMWAVHTRASSNQVRALTPGGGLFGPSRGIQTSLRAKW